MKKGFLIALCCLLVAQLTGCSIFGGDTQNLMRPPKATGAKAGVQQDIEKTVGSSVTYKYPQNGEYRSAVIMHDNYRAMEKTRLSPFTQRPPRCKIPQRELPCW